MRGCVALLLIVALGAGSAAAARDIIGADYAEPTSAYPHGVLGDDQEWNAVLVTLRTGGTDQTVRIEAGPDKVFEDTAPRLWDITGDGRPEVVVVASHQHLGAQLVVIGLDDGAVTRLAETPPIGTRFRWLAPVGAADLDGDGHIEIAYVDRPHLARTLRIWRYAPDGIAQIASLPGLTNHRIGEDFITGGIRDCGAGPEMILADADWRHIMAARLSADGLTARAIGPFTGKAAVDAALGCDGS